MQRKVEERRNDLRNTTILEAILVVIIVLLCVVYVKNIEFIDTEDILKAKIDRLNLENRRLQEENSGLKKKARRLEKEVESLKRKLERHRPLFPGDSSEDEDLEAKIEQLESTISQLRDKVKDLKAKLDENKNPGDGRGGIDLPSCLLMPNGRRESFADVSKKGGLIELVLTGSASKRKRVLSIPGASQLLNQGPVSLSKFEEFASLVYRHGAESTPPCRYFIKLDQDEWLGSELKILERFFYKWQVER